MTGVTRVTMIARLLLILFLVAITGGCTGNTGTTDIVPNDPEATSTQPAGSCMLNLPPATSDPDAIHAVLSAESDLMVKQDIDHLMRLWADESRVVDSKNTPNDSSDDQIWEGKDAIRHRYVRTVFPGAPTNAQPADLKIQITGDQATVQATTQIGKEVSPAGDRWTLIKTGGCWLIESLIYNLEPAH